MISLFNIKAVLLALLIVFAGLSCYSAVYYRQQAQQWKIQSKEKTRLIYSLQQRQEEVARLDKKHTQEMADAQSKIETLRLAVIAGDKRLHVRATCKPVHPAPVASGVDDAAAARLTADAEQHYYRLRQQINVVTAQVNGLQEYIKTHACPLSIH